MELAEIARKSNPLGAAGRLLGRLEAQEKTVGDARRIASGEQRLKYGFYSRMLRREVGVNEDMLPESFVDGYREAIADIRLGEYCSGDGDFDYGSLGEGVDYNGIGSSPLFRKGD